MKNGLGFLCGFPNMSRPTKYGHKVILGFLWWHTNMGFEPKFGKLMPTQQRNQTVCAGSFLQLKKWLNQKSNWKMKAVRTFWCLWRFLFVIFGKLWVTIVLGYTKVKELSCQNMDNDRKGLMAEKLFKGNKKLFHTYISLRCLFIYLRKFFLSSLKTTIFAFTNDNVLAHCNEEL